MRLTLKFRKFKEFIPDIPSDVKIFLVEKVDCVLKDSSRKAFFLYWAVLFFIQAVVTPSAMGFSFNPPILAFVLLQVVLVLFVVSTLPKRIERVRELLPVLSAIFLTIPTISITFTNSSLIDYNVSLLALLYVLINQFLISILISSIPHVEILKKRNGITYFKIALGLLCFVVAVALYAINRGINQVEFTTFYNIYEVRENFSRQLLQIGDPFLGHFIGWLGAFVPPILFLFGIKTKNYFFGVVSLVMASLMYSVAGQKWIIALMGFTLVFYLIGRPLTNQGFLLTHKLVDGINKLFAFSIFLQVIFYNSGIVDLIIRRTFLDPAIMLQFYTKYSLEYPMGLWRESKMAGLITGSQTPPLSNFIGDHYFNIPGSFFLPKFAQMNGTAGTLADSIAQAGLIGLIITSLIVFGFLILLEGLSVNRNKVVVFVISSLSIVALFEGTLLTLLFSRGLILIPLIILFLPRDKHLNPT